MTTQTDIKTQLKTAVVAPESVETESYLLGVLLIDGSQITAALAEKLHPTDFFLIAHQWVYAAMADLYQRGDSIDIATVSAELRARNQFEEIGGLLKLNEFMTQVTGYNWNVNTYAEIIRRQSEKRRLLEFHRISVQAIVNETNEQPLDLWADQMDALQQLRPVDTASDLLLGRDSMAYYVNALDEDLLNPMWFYLPLHCLTGAGATVYKPGDIITVAGGEGSGKSAFVFQYAQHLAQVDKRRVLVAFTEMDKKNILTRRKVRNNGKLNYTKLLTPEKLTQDQLAEVYRTDADLSDWVDHVDLWECGSLKAKSFIAELREKVSHYHYDVVIVDGFNDLHFEPVKGDNIPGAIHNFMAHLETFAREHNILLIGTVQLNDEGKSLGSRAYERKSSLYLKIETCRAEIDESLTYDGVTYGTTPGEWSLYRTIVIRKNRRGPTGGRARLPFVGPRFLWLDPSQVGSKTMVETMPLDLATISPAGADTARTGEM